MKLLSLFSGIGAFEKALDRLDIPYDLVGFSEIDKYAIESYCAIHNVDKSMNLGDITKIDGQALPKDIDLITYGFPCQDISLCGKMRGLFNEDGSQTRSGLFFEALRIIEDTQPKVAIAENVKNLTGKTFKAQFKIVLQSLEEAGYNNYWKVLNAKDYGVPQNRERVFIVSIRKDIDTGRFTFPEGFPLDLRLKDVLEKKVDEKYYLSVEKINSIAAWKAQQKPFERVLGNYSISPTLTARGAGEEHSGMILYGENLEGTTNLQERCLHCQGIIEGDLIIRKLTPRECFLLMNFDNEDFDACKKIGMSDTQLYKQAGNSIVVAVPYYIIKSLFEAGLFEEEIVYDICVNGKHYLTDEQCQDYISAKEENITESFDNTKPIEYIFNQNKLIDLLLREGIISAKGE